VPKPNPKVSINPISYTVRWGFDLEKLYAKKTKKIKRCGIKFLKKFYRKINQNSKEHNKANQNGQIYEILYDHPENS